MATVIEKTLKIQQFHHLYPNPFLKFKYGPPTQRSKKDKKNFANSRDVVLLKVFFCWPKPGYQLIKECNLTFFQVHFKTGHLRGLGLSTESRVPKLYFAIGPNDAILTQSNQQIELCLTLPYILLIFYYHFYHYCYSKQGIRIRTLLIGYQYGDTQLPCSFNAGSGKVL